MIDGHINPEVDVNTGIPQGSPVSPILFLIYISRVFEEVEEKVPQAFNLSFMDDLGFITGAKKVEDIVNILQIVNNVVI